jgi:hypothetical protein
MQKVFVNTKLLKCSSLIPLSNILSIIVLMNVNTVVLPNAFSVETLSESDINSDSAIKDFLITKSSGQGSDRYYGCRYDQ